MDKVVKKQCEFWHHAGCSEINADEAVDVGSVEYYDQLDAAARVEYRAHSVLTPATLAELDRIDAGRKARCLS